MRAKILGLQFRENIDSMEQERACIQREVGAYADVDFVTASDENIPLNNPDVILNGYHGVIIGGSSEYYFDGGRADGDEARVTSYVFLDRLRPLFEYLFEQDVPTLGICYGHQLLGAYAGAEVKYDRKQGKSRSHEIKLIVDKNNHFLFSDLPDSFQAHYGHKDSLDRVPEGAVLLMSGGDECKVSALQYKNNIYTTQFHPELNFGDMEEKMKNAPGYLPEGAVAEEIFIDDPHSNKILQNFGKFVAMQFEKQLVRVIAN